MMKFQGQTWALRAGFGCLLAVLACGSAFADEHKTCATAPKAGDVMVRLRAIDALPTVTATTTIGGDVDISQNVVPEIDVTYFFTQNISAELIAATTRHHVKALGTGAGNVDLGRVSLLPPTLTAQYHFLTEERISPYLGAGINYTMFYNAKTAPGSAVNNIHYENAFGLALQAGADIHVTGNWFANVDVKHIFLESHVSMNSGTYKADVSIDPTIVGVGLGYRF